MQDRVPISRRAPTEVMSLETAYGVFFELCPDLLCVVGQDGTLREVNGVWEKTLGFSRLESRGRKFLDWVLPEDRSGTESSLDRLTPGKTALDFENRWLAKDGQTIWVHWNACARTAPGGETLLFARGRDMTRFRAAESRLKTALEASLDAVFLLDSRRDANGNVSDFIFCETNRQGEELLRHSRQHLQGRALSTILPRIQKTRFFRKCLEVVETRIAVEEEFSLDFEQVDASWLRCQIVPVPEGLALTVRDISMRVSEQTRDQHAARMVLLGQMAGAMAHEINNPLAVIHGCAYLLTTALESGAIDAERIRTAAERLTRHGERIAKVVRGLKAFARDGSHDPFETKELKVIVDESLDMVRARLKNNEIELRLEDIPAGLRISCRPAEISQALMNLVHNAYDAVKGREKAWIEIGARDLGDSVELSVADSGPGVAPQNVSNLAVPFFTTKTLGQGIGLGLSVTDGIARGHGGALELDTVSPHTRFVLRLAKQPRHAEAA